MPEGCKTAGVTFTLHVDGPAWREQTTRVRDALREAIRGQEQRARLGDLVPVAKGNGYGLGLSRLADEATRLGMDRVAVGTDFEVAEVASRFAGDVLVLSPWDPRDAVAAAHWDALDGQPYADRVIRTLSEVQTAKQVPAGSRIVLEGITSMRRFGMLETDLLSLASDGAFQAALAAGDVRLEGLALHLPLAMPDIHVGVAVPRGTSTRVVEVQAWAKTWHAALEEILRAGCPVGENASTLWISHLTDDELRSVRSLEPDLAVNARVGTRLWLGDGSALRARGTILAVQTPAASLRQRAIAAGTGALEAAGRSRSPFSWGDRLLWFAEPPHMQVSMLWLPDPALREGTAQGQRTPAVGDTLDCRVRHTTALFDAVLLDG